MRGDTEAESPASRRRRYANALRVSRAGGYVYKNAPKCGCSTIKNALWLAEIESGRFAGAPPDEVQIHLVGEGTPWSWDVNETAGKFIFTFVRNPYERIYGVYLNKCVKAAATGAILPVLRRELGVGARPVAFADFLAFVRAQSDFDRDAHWRSIYATTLEDILPSHFIGALERFDADFAALMARLFLTWSGGARIVNARSPLAQAPAPTRAELDAIADIYAHDFEFYGYSLDPARSSEAPSRVISSALAGAWFPPAS